MRSNFELLPTPKGSTCMGAGLVALDLIEQKGGHSSWAAAGGSCGNVLTILSWLGWESKPVARLGDDRNAKELNNDLAAFGVDTALIQHDTTVQTPVVIHRISTDSTGGGFHRFLLVCPECGTWLPRYRPILITRSAQIITEESAPSVFFFDRIAPANFRLAAWAKSEGALIVFEPSSIGDEAKFQKAVDLCHILKYSDERLGRIDDLRFARTPPLIVETRGENGLRFRWKSKWTSLKAIPAKTVVDPAGSGDWCTAGMIHALGRRGATSLLSATKPALTYALQLGQALAAINCGYEGARGLMYYVSANDVCLYLSQYSLGNQGIGTLDSSVTTPETHASRLSAICHVCDDGKFGFTKSGTRNR